MAEEWTIGRLLQWTADYLQQHGTDSPRLEAEVLLAHARGCQRMELYTSFDEPADDELRTRFRELVRRRAEGCRWLISSGTASFSPRLPRHSRRAHSPPETELLVHGCCSIDRDRGREPPSRVADVGTGSCIIAIAGRTAPQARDGDRHQPGGVGRGTRERRAARRGRTVTFVAGDLLAGVPDSRRSMPSSATRPMWPTANSRRCTRTCGSTSRSRHWWPAQRALEVIERLIAAGRRAAGWRAERS